MVQTWPSDWRCWGSRLVRGGTGPRAGALVCASCPSSGQVLQILPSLVLFLLFGSAFLFFREMCNETWIH